MLFHTILAIREHRAFFFLLLLGLHFNFIILIVCDRGLHNNGALASRLRPTPSWLLLPWLSSPRWLATC